MIPQVKHNGVSYCPVCDSERTRTEICDGYQDTQYYSCECMQCKSTWYRGYVPDRGHRFIINARPTLLGLLLSNVCLN